MSKVCLILGAGAGIGLAVAKRFSAEGYHICLVRRSNQAGLDRAVQELSTNGQKGIGIYTGCDIT
jgi:NAD(P)-dependent dehydrogenase (short-subunit alcohol dehydrogenase family)